MVADKVMLKGLPADVDGVPPRIAVPSPLSLKLIPAGKIPVAVSAGVGTPLEVTLKAPVIPAVNVALLPLVRIGACGVPLSVSVKPCWASGDTPLLAVKIMLNGLPAGVAGVPRNVAVPFPLSVKLRPSGNGPVSVIEGFGENPVVVTVNEFA